MKTEPKDKDIRAKRYQRNQYSCGIGYLPQGRLNTL